MGTTDVLVSNIAQMLSFIVLPLLILAFVLLLRRTAHLNRKIEEQSQRIALLEANEQSLHEQSLHKEKK